MSDDDIKLLEENGWDVECQSPFEIRGNEGDPESFASGMAAKIILDLLQKRKRAKEKRIARKQTGDKPTQIIKT